MYANRLVSIRVLHIPGVCKRCMISSSSNNHLRNGVFHNNTNQRKEENVLHELRVRRKNKRFRLYHNNSHQQTKRRLHVESSSAKNPQKNPNARTSFVNSTQAPSNFHPQSAIVYENIISSHQGKVLQNDILKLMRRKRFEKGHWDAVITNYKEIELPNRTADQNDDFISGRTGRILSKESYDTIDQIRSFMEKQHSDLFLVNKKKEKNNQFKWLPVHAIHLKESGKLSAHVDSVRFSGGIVAGLSLSTSSIMRLKPASPSEIASSIDSSSSSRYGSVDENHDHHEPLEKSIDDAGHVDLYLPPLSLYILSGISRYEYTHELLDSAHEFVILDGKDNTQTVKVDRADRISVIFRDAKE